MKITLQQCIFLISNLTKKQTQLTSLLTGQYVVPLAVNGKDTADKTKEEQMRKDLDEIDVLSEDIVRLKSALSLANNENKMEGRTIYEVLEEVRIKRSVLYQVQYSLDREYSKVETGVGVVRYGVLNEELMREKRDSLEKEVNSLSEKVDVANASIQIEVDLLGTY
ncbi:hypothetical protein [Filifactor villosus]|uniref:Uncharacterized protein n=1 Tax=Filifactor villosus TaxID=29374 RepID=A0ABV9QPT6_9FIRM